MSYPTGTGGQLINGRCGRNTLMSQHHAGPPARFVRLPLEGRGVRLDTRRPPRATFPGMAHHPSLDDQGRPEPPLAGDETATLVGFLEYQRATFRWKTDGLDAEGFRRTVGGSSMTLGGMMKHLAVAEDGWFTESLRDEPLGSPWDDVDWNADRDWEWHTAAGDDPDELRALWRAAVGRSRTHLEEALAGDGLNGLARRTWADGRAPSLRWILCHMIEEYARHNGHADLIRDSIDGATGE